MNICSKCYQPCEAELCQSCKGQALEDQLRDNVKMMNEVMPEVIKLALLGPDSCDDNTDIYTLQSS